MKILKSWFLTQTQMSEPRKHNDMKKYLKTEKLQKALYNTIASDYAKYYDGPCCQMYHDKFINAPMLENICLARMTVINAMCSTKICIDTQLNLL